MRLEGARRWHASHKQNASTTRISIIYMRMRRCLCACKCDSNHFLRAVHAFVCKRDRGAFMHTHITGIPHLPVARIARRVARAHLYACASSLRFAFTCRTHIRHHTYTYAYFSVGQVQRRMGCVCIYVCVVCKPCCCSCVLCRQFIAVCRFPTYAHL